MDNCFFACCILHNILLAFDHLDDGADAAMWQAADGLHGDSLPFEDEDADIRKPQRVEYRSGHHRVRRDVNADDDFSMMGSHEEGANDVVEPAEESSYLQLRDRLVAHYYAVWQRNEVEWFGSGSV